MKSAVVAALFTAAALAGSPALAQPGMTPAGPPGTAGPSSEPPPPPPSSRGQVAATNKERGGILLGGSAGVGLRSDGGFAGSFTVGYLLSPSLALIGDGTILGDGCDFDCVDEVRSLGVIGGGLKWMLTPRVWAQGTIGVGFADLEAEDEDAGGLGWTGAAGFDFFSGPSAALDLRFSLLGGFFEDLGPVRGTIGIGLTIR